MRNLLKTVLALVVMTGAALTTAHADKLYKWVDENGVVHYGDAIPAKYATTERHVLNEHGVTTDVLERAKTREELAAMEAAQREIERQRKQQKIQSERDRILLDTYLSEEEIAMLRDRRILSIEARIGLTRHYLDNLRARWDELESETRKFNFPYDPASELPPLPEDLAKDIVFIENAMAEHMTTLRDLRTQQSVIRDEFEQDIQRFRALKAQKDAEEELARSQ